MIKKRIHIFFIKHSIDNLEAEFLLTMTYLNPTSQFGLIKASGGSTFIIKTKQKKNKHRTN
jgi:hypothetical protein